MVKRKKVRRSKKTEPEEFRKRLEVEMHLNAFQLIIRQIIGLSGLTKS